MKSNRSVMIVVWGLVAVLWGSDALGQQLVTYDLPGGNMVGWPNTLGCAQGERSASTSPTDDSDTYTDVLPATATATDAQITVTSWWQSGTATCEMRLNGTLITTLTPVGGAGCAGDGTLTGNGVPTGYIPGGSNTLVVRKNGPNGQWAALGTVDGTFGYMRMRFTYTGPASTAIWEGDVSTDWGTAGNWSTGAVPTAATDVIIPTLVAPTGFTRVFWGGSTTNNNPTIPGAGGLCNNLTIAAGRTLSLSSNTLTVSGSVTNAGTIDGGTGTLLFNGAVAATLTNTGTINAFNLTINKTTTSVTTASSFTVNSAFTVMGDATFSATAGTITFAGAGVGNIINTSSAAAPQLTFFGITLNKGAGVNVDTSASFSVSGGYTNTLGNLNCTGGTVTYIGGAATHAVNGGSVQYNNLTISKTAATLTHNTATGFTIVGNYSCTSGTFDATNGVVTFAGGSASSLESTGTLTSFYSLTLNQSAGIDLTSTTNWTFKANYTNTSGDLICSAGTVTWAGTIAGTLSVGGGTVQFNNFTLNSTGGFTLNHATGSFDIIGNYTRTAGIYTSTGGNTLTMSGTVAATLAATSSTFNNLTINKTAAVAVSNATTFTVSGAFTVTGSTTFNSTGGTISIAGNFALTGAATFNQTGGTTTLNGTVASTITDTSTGTITFNAFTTNKTVAGVAVTTTADFTVSSTRTNTTGDFTASGGTITFAGASVSHTINSGTVRYNNFTVAKNAGATLTNGVATTWFVDGSYSCTSGSFDMNAGTIQFAGSTATTIAHAGAGTTTFFNVTINKTAATVSTTSDWNVDAVMTVQSTATFLATGGTVTFTSGTAGTISNTSTAAAPQLTFFNMTVNKTAGTLTTGNNFSIAGNYTNTIGTFTCNAPSVVTFNGTADRTSTITAGAVTFNDLTIAMGAGTTLTHTGDFSLRSDYACTGGSFNATAGTVTAINDGALSTYSHAGAGTTTFFNLTNTKFDGITHFNINIASDISIAGNYTNTSGNLNCTAGTVTFVGNSASIQMNGGVSWDFNNLTVSKTAGQTLTHSTGSFDINLNYSCTSGSFSSTSVGTITFGGGSVGSIAHAGAGTTTFNNIQLNKGAGVDVTSTTDWRVSGNYTNTAGDLVCTGGTVTWVGAAAQTLQINGGTVQFFHFTVAMSGAFTLTQNTGSFRIDGNYSCTTGSFNATVGAVTFGGGGASNISDTSAGTTSFFGLTINKAAGGVQVTSTTDWTVNSTYTNTLGDLVCTGGTVTMGGTVGSNLSINGGSAQFNNLTIAMSATIIRTHNAGSFNIIGNYSCTSGAFSSTAGTVTMNGTSDTTISHTSTDTTTFNNLTIAKTAAAVQSSANFTVNASLSVTGTARFEAVAGTITFASATAGTIVNTSTAAAPQLTLFNVTVNKTGALTSTANFTVTGNWTNTAGNVTHTAGTVTFAGAATRSMTMTAGAIDFNNVVVNMAGGTNLNQSGVGFDVGGNFTVTGGTFNATAGTIVFGGTTQAISSTAGTIPVFSTLTVGASSTLTLANDVDVSVLLTVTGTLQMTGNQTLRIGTTGASGTVTVNGTLNCSGATPTITARAAGFRMTFNVNGTINVTALNFSLANASGMNLAAAATVTALNNVAFTNASTRHLTILCVANMTFLGCSFDASFSTNNVQMNNAASNVVMGNWTGAGGGAAFHSVLAGILTWWASAPPNAPDNLTVNQVTNPNRPRFQARFTDADAPDTANAFQIQVSTDNTFATVTHWDSGLVTLSPQVANGATMPEQMYGGTFLSWGTQYFWRILFRDNNNAIGAWSATGNFTMPVPSTTFPVTGWNMFGVQSGATQTVAAVLGDDIPGPIVYEWNEVSQTYQQVTNLVAGRGYLVFSNPAFVDSDAGTARYGNLTLTNLSYTTTGNSQLWGRHLISHPFGISVNWSTIVAGSTNLVNTYDWWNGTSYISYNSATGLTDPPGNPIPPWRGIWVRVTSATNSIVIPNPKNPPEPPPPSFDANFWAIQLRVDSGAAQDTSNFAGVHPNAVDTLDIYDVRDPGTLANPFVIGYFDETTWGADAGRYAHVLNQTPFAAGNQQRYPLTIEQNTGADVTLSFPNFNSLPTTDWAYQLQDMDSLQTWNIVSGFTMTYTPAGATKRYDVIATRLNDFTSRLDCSLGPQNPSAGPVGSTQTNVPVMQLRMAAVNEAITVEQIRMRAAGSGNDATMLSAARLYHDVNRNGAVDAGDTLIEGPDTFGTDDGNILWWNLDWGIPMNGNEDWLVVYDFSAANSNGGDFRAWFTPSADVVARGQSSQMLIVGNGAVVTGNNKTAPDTLAPVAPVLAAPADGSWTSNDRPLLDWNDVEAGLTYRLQADNDADVTSPFLDQSGIASSELTPGAPFPSTTIYWRVAASDGAGNVGPWSATGWFRLDATPPIAGTVNDGLGTDLAFQGSTTTLSANWMGFGDPESGIIGYDWAIGTSPGATDVRAFTPMGVATSGTVSSLTLTGGTLYYSTVRAWNVTGLVATSSSDGVLVDTTPPTSGFVNDGLGGDLVFQSSTTTLSANWDSFEDPESGIADYEWAIGTTPGAQDVQAFVSTAGGTIGTNGTLTLIPGATYYSTVRATSGVGQTSLATSDGVTIDTTPPTAGSAFVNDGNGEDLDRQTSNTTLSANWGGFEDAESAIGGYSWAVGTTPGGTDVRGFLEVGGATTATDATLALAYGTTYFVTVRAMNRAGLDVSLSSDGVTPVSSRNEVSVGLGAGSSGYVAEFDDGAAGGAFLSWSQVPWNLYNQRNGETHVAQGDVNGDGLDEQVVGFGSTGLGWLAVRSSLDGGRAIVRWLQVPWQDYNSYSGTTWPACGNVDDDPRSEIVVGLGEYRTNGGWMVLFDDEATGCALLGWRRPNWPAYNSADGQLRPAIGDVDGDGRGEVVLGMGPAASGWLLVMEDWPGGMRRRAGIRVPWSAYNAANGETWPACGDLDGDGRAEIAVGLGRGGAGQVCLFEDAAAGHAMTRWVTMPWSLYNASAGDTRPSIGNLDTDTTEDLVVGLGPGGGGYWLMFGNATDDYALRGWRRVSWPVYNSSNGETRPSVGDGAGD